MAQFVQLLVNGAALGGIYALVALGFILVSQGTGIVNFATGQFVMVGAFFAVTTVLQFGLGTFPGAILALLVMAVFGLVFFLIVHKPLQSRSAVTVIMGTVFIGITIQNLGLLTWGALPIRPPSPFGSAIMNIGGAIVSVHSAFTILVTIVMIALLYMLLYRSAFGNQMRAVAQDPEAAVLMGIRKEFILASSWIIAALLAGVAGILLGPIWFADVTMGDPIALKAFAAAIIGGFGSIHGAILGGLFVGLAEMFGAAYITSAYKDALVFLIMLTFLVFRPEGIFAERIGTRG